MDKHEISAAIADHLKVSENEIEGLSVLLHSPMRHLHRALIGKKEQLLVREIVALADIHEIELKDFMRKAGVTLTSVKQPKPSLKTLTKAMEAFKAALRYESEAPQETAK